MTIDELKKKLEERGIEVGGWNSASGGEVNLEAPAKIQKMVAIIEEHLESQIREKTAQLEDAKKLLSQMKYGGGE